MPCPGQEKNSEEIQDLNIQRLSRSILLGGKLPVNLGGKKISFAYYFYLPEIHFKLLPLLTMHHINPSIYLQASNNGYVSG